LAIGVFKHSVGEGRKREWAGADRRTESDPNANQVYKAILSLG